MVDPNSQDIQAILSELRDVNKDKRRTAVMKLGMVGGDEAIRALIYTLDNIYEDLLVRSRAALLLGRMGDARAVDPLIRALDAPGFQTPFNAVQSLGRLGDARAIEPLVGIFETKRDRMRDAAQDALILLGYDVDEGTLPTPEPTPEPEPEL